jgi:hypothetical protein
MNSIFSSVSRTDSEPSVGVDASPCHCSKKKRDYGVPVVVNSTPILIIYSYS